MTISREEILNLFKDNGQLIRETEHNFEYRIENKNAIINLSYDKTISTVLGNIENSFDVKIEYDDKVCYLFENNNSDENYKLLHSLLRETKIDNFLTNV